MTEREHILGDTAFYDARRNVRFRNSMVIEVDLDRATWEIKGVGARKGHTIQVTNPAFIRVMRLVIKIAQREARYAEPVTPLWKHRSIPPEEAVPACPECEDRRFLEDPTTGEEWPCPTCNAG